MQGTFDIIGSPSFSTCAGLLYYALQDYNGHRLNLPSLKKWDFLRRINLWFRKLLILYALFFNDCLSIRSLRQTQCKDRYYSLSCSRSAKRNFKLFSYTLNFSPTNQNKTLAYGNFFKFNSENQLQKQQENEYLDLNETKFVLIRQNPPFDLSYLTNTFYS